MRLINLFSFSLILFLFGSSCGSKSSNKVVAAPVDSIVSYRPDYATPLPEAEVNLLHNEVKDWYEKHLVRTGFNGGILVAKKGEVVFEDYHGYYNLRKKDSLTKHSAFHLASVSKTFTAMAVLRLVELGKLSLNDDLKKFFPNFPYDNITVKLLLNHRSGLPNYIYFMQQLGWDTKKHVLNQDVLDYLIKFKPAATRPDTHFTYCNTNYALLGLVIEKASGESYADFIKQQFFKPLHMDDSYVYNISDSATAMPSYDYRGRQEAFTFLDCGIGDKNIYSTPEDLLKWDQALYTNKLFTKAILDEAFTPYSNERPGIRNYGLGWRMNVYPDGKKIIYHNGWWHGNNAVFIRMIQDTATIIVLGNKYNRNIYEAKDMEKFFSGSYLPQGEEGNEEVGAPLPPKPVVRKKRAVTHRKSVSHKKTAAKQHNSRHRK